MNRLWIIVLTVAMTALLTAGCSRQVAPALQGGDHTAGNAKFVVGYTNLDDTDVICTSRKNSLMRYAQQDAGMEIRFADAKGNINKQLDQIDEFIAQKVNAIVILAVDSNEIIPGVKKANAAGIPVIALGNQINGGEFTFIGVPNYDAGKIQGEFMRDRLPPKARILYVQGTNGLYHATERWKGFKEALLDKRPDIILLDSLSGNYDRAEGLKLVENWIRIFPQFDAVIAANDQMAMGAIEALKMSGRLQGVMISGVDGIDDALQAINRGEMSQTLLQDTEGQGKVCYELLQSIARGEKPPKEVMVPFKPVTRDNLAEYLK
ncbi:sugar ABC transporter substrate-binding protein [Propionispora vibrioides]|uniref:Monosaccharide ABC transporter substrate-binding protein, CUT2 family n=1 Tax=Propionispora vibrioides TaxID=112903 RepID=A0A1H8W564_9FIRM|nr:sugar ABC transporter substrate-binding protein [Propionispora vibrioides]SEP22739.1 monosaccharide ABC transporter substrate-binding protein, CUT2 family [Propionispora vibrioides]